MHQCLIVSAYIYAGVCLCICPRVCTYTCIYACMYGSDGCHRNRFNGSWRTYFLQLTSAATDRSTEKWTCDYCWDTFAWSMMITETSANGYTIHSLWCFKEPALCLSVFPVTNLPSKACYPQPMRVILCHAGLLRCPLKGLSPGNGDITEPTLTKPCREPHGISRGYMWGTSMYHHK